MNVNLKQNEFTLFFFLL